jgi:hypothetical protein
MVKANISQPPLRVLYLGDTNPHTTSMHRAQALRRIGCDVECLNPGQAYAGLTIPRKVHYLTGYHLMAPLVQRWLARQIHGKRFDLVWVNGGHDVSTRSVVMLKKHFGQVINYMNDDPTGPRDPLNWGTYRRAIASYDLSVLVRAQNEGEFIQSGARKVLRVWMSYDELAHAPFPSENSISAAFRSEVAFVGTWMKDEGAKGRDYILLELINAGIPVSFWGDRWENSPCWPQIRPHWRGGSLFGRDYVAAIQGANLCLALLSKGNRDLHTTRSVEIPYAGGLLCGERTSEHLQIFQEDVEAVFWSSPEECIQVCRSLLADEPRRCQIQIAGMKRIRNLGFGNETICRKILVEMGYDSFQNEATKHLFRLQPLHR